MSEAKIITNYGEILIELDHSKSPKTVNNFVKYVKSGYYQNVIFHRVIPGFMIQTGGFHPGMNEKSAKYPSIRNEANNGVLNKKYSVAMARTSDPHSASSQFFINVMDNDFLNHTEESVQGWGYAVFGLVTTGKDIVHKIESVPTGFLQGHQDVPKEEVIIKRIELLE